MRIHKMQLWYPSVQVVDARAGPGIKSFTKFKSKNRKLVAGDKGLEKTKKKVFERWVKERLSLTIHSEPLVVTCREYSPALSDKSDVVEDMEINDMDFLYEEGPR